MSQLSGLLSFRVPVLVDFLFFIVLLWNVTIISVLNFGSYKRNGARQKVLE
jgi:hypothetical protein